MRNAKCVMPKLAHAPSALGSWLLILESILTFSFCIENYFLGNHQASVNYLSRITEDDHYDETHRTTPSPQLRRYVMMLRRIEYHPASAPQTLAAIRGLERARQRNAAKLLVASRGLVETEKSNAKPEHQVAEVPQEMSFAPSLPLSAISAPPPISKVLHDVYQDETRANN